MSKALSVEEVTATLRDASSSAYFALERAIDELQRAALICRQTADPATRDMRAPSDWRCIADQFSEQAQACKAAQARLWAAFAPKDGAPS